MSAGTLNQEKKPQCCMCHAAVNFGQGVERQDGKLSICKKCIGISARAIKDPKIASIKVIDFVLYSMLDGRAAV
jgi:hypothetical protein